MEDDRGQRVVVLRRVAFEPWPVRGDARIELLVRRLAIAVRGERSWLQTLAMLGMAIGCFVLVICAVALFSAYAGGLPMWIGAVGILGGVYALGRFLSRGQRAMTSRRIVAVVLKEGLCACCGYNLHGSAGAEDGCVVCPECGSAWRGTRIRRTAAFAVGTVSGHPKTAMSSQRHVESWTTKDDAGECVELASPRLAKAIRAASGEREARLRAAREETARRSRWVRWPVMGTVWAGGAGIMVMLARASGHWGPPLLFGAVCVAVCLMMAYTNFLYSRRAMRRAMLARGMCPSCTSELFGARDAAGAVWCRGCLGDWRAGSAAAAGSGDQADARGGRRDARGRNGDDE